MTIATKSGSVVIKDGSVAQDCNCCGGAPCACSLSFGTPCGIARIAVSAQYHFTPTSQRPFVAEGTYEMSLTEAGNPNWGPWSEEKNIVDENGCVFVVIGRIIKSGSQCFLSFSIGGGFTSPCGILLCGTALTNLTASAPLPFVSQGTGPCCPTAPALPISNPNISSLCTGSSWQISAVQIELANPLP